MKTIKKFNEFIKEEFFFFGGELQPDFLKSIFERIIEILKRNGDVSDVVIGADEHMYLHFVYDGLFYSISPVDKRDLSILVEKDGITDVLVEYDAEEIDKIIKTIINNK